tara:strand:+ start:2036 stop:2323 length:288 start_codon:yes stop_codon:yes gene_type:complete
MASSKNFYVEIARYSVEFPDEEPTRSEIIVSAMGAGDAFGQVVVSTNQHWLKEKFVFENRISKDPLFRESIVKWEPPGGVQILAIAKQQKGDSSG